MDILFASELFQLIFNQFDREPDAFVRLFDDSQNFMAYDYLCEKKEFLDVSSSFTEIFGYPKQSIVGKKEFFQKNIHADDEDLFLGFFNMLPKGEKAKINKHQRAWLLDKMKCRVKHRDGHWKEIIIYSFTYFIEIRGWHKVGMLTEAQSRAGNNEFSVIGKQAKREAVSWEKKERVKVSKRESEVLALLGQGMIAKEIADKLCISTSTVITHKKNLINKMGVKNTAQLISKASNMLLL
ncbi:LuxR C-terminal-related transcriptional regulator [Flammeovirgaceae bacterium SG7u.111]|nr:LuxR C-terminal-related transcriptional regulator [Flammeovirgaceae bacterium SG7u.132]WPO36473.1 LuxR C-terminal-related transcriptional regulator [Flammeovirgaceae bacterium SG7u.111]